MPPVDTVESIPLGTTATLLSAVAGIVGVVYAVGGAVVWSRLHGAGIAADEAIGSVPQQTIAAVGARQLAVPFAVVVGMASLVAWWERRRPNSSPKRAPDPKSSKATKPRGPIASVLARPLRILWRPLRWYLAHVPSWAYAPLPLILFTSDPLGTCIILLNGAMGAALGEWFADSDEHPWRTVRFWAVTAAGVATIGLVTEWHEPKHLPGALVTPVAGKPFQASFVAMSGGDLYVVTRSKLTVIPSASYRSVTVSKASKRVEDHSRGLAVQAWDLIF